MAHKAFHRTGPAPIHCSFGEITPHDISCGRYKTRHSGGIKYLAKQVILFYNYQNGFQSHITENLNSTVLYTSNQPSIDN